MFYNLYLVVYFVSQVMFIDNIEEPMFLVSASCLYLFYNQYLVVYFVRLNQLV